MKRAILAATALLSSTILISSQAFAAVTLISSTPAADPSGLNAANLVLAQGVCDAAAAAADADGAGAQSDIYTGEVVEGAATLVSGPTEVGSHTFAANGIGTQTGAGTFTPAHREIEGNPYRNGGSVNMFGNQVAVGGAYSASSYDFENNFTTTYAHPFTCDISMEDYHAAVVHPPVHTDQVGHWEVSPDFHGNEEQMTQNCHAFNTSLPGGPNNHNSDTNQANCVYTVDTPASDTPGSTDPEYWDEPVFVSNVAGGSYNQDQTDSLTAHESNGEGFSTSETLNIGQVVVCISPTVGTTKKPGAWVLKNGYTGSLCTTAWYTSGAMVGVSNLNTGSHNWVTVPVN
jgi:hypothetical protein